MRSLWLLRLGAIASFVSSEIEAVMSAQGQALLRKGAIEATTKSRQGCQ
jgi:hypothetical protein